MAAKKKIPTKKTITTTIEEPEGEELDAFDRARLEFEGLPGVKLTIYRYDDGETAYLKRIDYEPSAVDEEWIRKRWGAGSYQLRFTDGSRMFSKVVTIATDVPPASPAPASSSGDALFIQTMQRQNEIMLQGLLSRLSSPAPAGGGGGGGGGNEALVELVRGMQAQNTELLRSSLNRPDISATLLQVLEKGMAIASETRLEAEGGWMAQLARIAREVLPTFAEMARARAAMPIVAGGNTPGAVPALPAPAPGAAPGPNGGAAAPAPKDGLDLDELVRAYAPSILEAIGNRAAPADVADAILDHIPAAFYGAFDELTPERAIRVAPALSQHQGYVAELVGSIQSAIRGEEGSDS